MSFEFWKKYLLAVSFVFVFFGVLLAFFGTTAPFAIMNESINSVFWAVTDVPDVIAAYQRWSYGVLGATMAGWGVFFIFLITYAFPKKEPWVWNCIVYGISIWFLIDTGISMHFRVAFNVVFNSVTYIALAIPLIIVRKEFKSKR